MPRGLSPGWQYCGRIVFLGAPSEVQQFHGPVQFQLQFLCLFQFQV